MRYRIFLGILVCAPLAVPQTADEGGAIFQKYVLPALKEKCQSCHGPALQTNNLALTSRDSTLRGGTRGPAIVPGAAAKSLLVAAIEQQGALKMPPEQKLPAETVAAIRRWIDLGAPWIDTGAATEPRPSGSGPQSPDDTWAFRPVKRQAIPKANPTAIFTPVDAFILDKLHEKASPRPPAPIDAPSSAAPPLTSPACLPPPQS